MAQAGCGVAWTTPFRVENDTSVSILRQAANCTGGGALKADWAGAPVSIGAPIAVASGIFLSITGEDALAEADANLQTRLFEVSPGGELTLTRLKLSGGVAENGGAIYSDFGKLTLDGCTFNGNSATDGDGGAVWADRGTVTIVGGGFLDNNATGYGGAVFATDATLVIQEGSKFESNEASIGGALFCGGVGETRSANTAASGSSCSISDAVFASNTANDGGPNELHPYVEHDGGGAAAFLRANVTLVGSSFSGNYARRSGGALYGGNATDIKADGCLFKTNTAERHGGAILASSLALGGSTRLVDNVAGSDGGAVSATNYFQLSKRYCCCFLLKCV